MNHKMTTSKKTCPPGSETDIEAIYGNEVYFLNSFENIEQIHFFGHFC